MSAEHDESNQLDDDAPREKRQRRVFPRLDFNASAWATTIGDEDLLDYMTIIARFFRWRLRTPYTFMELVKIVKRGEWFTTHQVDTVRLPIIPVELKVRIVLHSVFVILSQLLFKKGYSSRDDRHCVGRT